MKKSLLARIGIALTKAKDPSLAKETAPPKLSRRHRSNKRQSRNTASFAIVYLGFIVTTGTASILLAATDHYSLPARINLWIIFSFLVFQTLVSVRFMMIIFKQRRFEMRLGRAVVRLDNKTKELQNAHSFLNSIVNSIPDPVFIKGKDHKWLVVNDAFIHFLGRPREALIGKSEFDVLPLGQAQTCWEKDEETYQKRTTINHQQLDSKVGTRIVETKKVLLKNISGEEVLLGIIRDITDEKNRQLWLDETNQFLDSSQEVARMGSFSWNFPTHKIWWSTNLFSLLGLSRNTFEPTADNVETLVHPNDRAYRRLHLIESSPSAPAKILTYRMRHSDGHYVKLQVRIKSQYNSDGERGLTIATVQDMTEWDSEQERLLASKALLDEAQQVAHLGSWEHNMKTGEVRWSDESFRIRGLEPQSVLPTMDLFMKHVLAADRELVQSVVNVKLSTKQEYNDDYRIKTADGRIRHIHSRGRMLLDENGEVSRYYGTEQDITDQRQIQATLAEHNKMVMHASRLSTLGEMAAGMGHEINTPLASVRMQLDRIKRAFTKNATPEPEKMVMMCDRAVNTLQTISDIIQSMRALAHGEDGPMDQYFALSATIRQVATLAKKKLSNLGVKIEIQDEVGSSYLSKGNPVQLYQVLVNLLNNATDASVAASRHERWIRVSLKEAGDGSVELAVTDSGTAMNSKIASKLFQPYFTTKAVGTGTGLGLHLSKKIVETHGGKIFLDTQSVNTRFVVTLPAELVKDNAA